MVLSKIAKKIFLEGRFAWGHYVLFSPVKREVTGTFQSPDKVSPMITETEGKTTYQHCERIT